MTTIMPARPSKNY